MSSKTDLLNKIAAQRKTHNTRKGKPYITFYDKVFNAENLLNQIEAHIKSSDLLQESRVQFIIALITAFEVYFKDMLIESFDKCKSSIIMANCKLIKLDQKFTFSEIVDFYANNIKVQEILRAMVTFQSLDTIFDYFGKLSQLDISTQIMNYKVPIKDHSFSLKEDTIRNLTELISLRHTVTHEIDIKLNIDKNKCDDFFYHLILFIFVFDKYYYNEFLDKNAKEMPNSTLRTLGNLFGQNS
jgi:hypothetical protein